MAGYVVENTLTDNGTVSRGVCTVDARQMLLSIIERTKLRRMGKEIVDMDSGAKVPLGTPVSLNLWGFAQGVMELLENEFACFLRSEADLLKDEFYLPSFVDALVRRGEATVSVLFTNARPCGVTYRQDRKPLMDAIAQMTAKGIYPQPLYAMSR